MTARCLWLLLVAACAKPATSAGTFANGFGLELTPVAAAAGDYAMSLRMEFESYPSMELRISEQRDGVMKLALGSDGAALACLGAKTQSSTLGQYKYEPPERREGLRSNGWARLVSLTGTWSVGADGITTVKLDRVAWSTCDAGTAQQLEQPLVELRCVGFHPSSRVPVSGLACEASAKSDLLRLGMPIGVDGGTSPGPIQHAPDGRRLLLGAGGLRVEVDQRRHSAVPAFKFLSGAVTLEEKNYLK